MRHWQSGSRLASSPKLACFVALALTAFGLSLATADAPSIITPSPCSKPLSAELFSRWPAEKKPDVALLLSGEQHSYLKFCGCSEPQYGGYERRYNFLAKLRDKGWPVVSLDLGDLVLEKTGGVHEQTMLKYAAAMSSLNALGYSAVGVGPNDFNLPLNKGILELAKQLPNPNQRILAANVLDRVQNFTNPNDPDKSILEELVVVPGQNGAPTVGAVAVLAPSARKNIQDSSIKFADNQQLIPQILKTFDEQKVDLRVLLYQGTPEEAAAAAKTFPQFHVILSRTLSEEPPAAPTMVGNTMIIEVGWRGRYVGVVGAFRNEDGKTFDLQYQLVRLGPEFETDKEKQEKHPVLDILQTYAQRVKEENLMLKVTKMPHPMQVKFPNATYLGSDKCAMCHQAEFAKWKASGHSHAWEALTKKATKPTLRQFDGECIVCHVVGYTNTSGFVDEKTTPHLLNVGCENCHGPGSVHAANKDNQAFRDAMMPWRTPGTKDKVLKDGKYDQALLLKINDMCQKCHDVDNDPEFRFENFWPNIHHSRGPKPPPGPNPVKPKK